MKKKQLVFVYLPFADFQEASLEKCVNKSEAVLGKKHQF